MDGEQEALRFKWIESERAGYDLGEEAIRRWVAAHWHPFLKARWVEHLAGLRSWIELDGDDFGLLRREFPEPPPFFPALLDRVKTGNDNLGVLTWAADQGLPLETVVRVLEVLDINSCRLPFPLDPNLRRNAPPAPAPPPPDEGDTPFVVQGS